MKIRPQDAFVDPMPSVLRRSLKSGEDTHRKIAAFITKQFGQGAHRMVRRWSELPDLDPTMGSHVSLLQEARDLYVHGHFYSCVAMCGITSERIVKDILREHFAIRKNRRIIKIRKEAVAELDRFEAVAIARFLTKAKLLDSTVKNDVVKLAEIRNVYAHGSGVAPQADSLETLKLLHGIVERTVSLLKNHERFGSAPQKDVLEGASGKFGREPSNPIPGDYREYCAQLCCPQKHPYHFKRKGSVGRSGPDKHYVDRIVLRCFGGEDTLDLYFDVYHSGISARLPKGLRRGPSEGRWHPSGPGPFRTD